MMCACYLLSVGNSPPTTLLHVTGHISGRFGMVRVALKALRAKLNRGLTSPRDKKGSCHSRTLRDSNITRTVTMVEIDSDYTRTGCWEG